MPRLTELDTHGDWTYKNNVSLAELCEKLAYYEGLEDMAKEQCPMCKASGYYAEWGNCDECGFKFLQTE